MSYQTSYYYPKKFSAHQQGKKGEANLSDTNVYPTTRMASLQSTLQVNKSGVLLLKQAAVHQNIDRTKITTQSHVYAIASIYTTSCLLEKTETTSKFINKNLAQNARIKPLQSVCQLFNSFFSLTGYCLIQS